MGLLCIFQILCKMEVESGGSNDFEGWLCSKLKEIGLDEDVFGSYVTGVLDEEDTSDEDRQEALAGLLHGMTESPAEEVSAEILQRWKSSRADKLKKRQHEKEQEALDKKNRLAKIMEKQAATVAVAKSTNTVDEEIKNKLLNEYGHQSEEESLSDSEDEIVAERLPPRLTGNESDLFKNTNAQTVLDKEKEKRDKQKNESEQKKQQIKEAKEKQKHKAEERKEKEKKRTQKGERRR